jgi:hypothetical protein
MVPTGAGAPASNPALRMVFAGASAPASTRAALRCAAPRRATLRCAGMVPTSAGAPASNPSAAYGACGCKRACLGPRCAALRCACPRPGYGRRVWCLRVMARLPRPPAPRMVSARAGAPASTRAVLCCTALRRAAHARHPDHRRVGDQVWCPRVLARLPRPTHTPAVLLANTPTPQCALGLRLC